MQILYSSLHNLDMAQDRPVRKAIPADFNSYMDAYIKFATTENNSSREYNPIDSNRTVLRCVSTIFTDVLHQGDVVTDSESLDEHTDSIALKLLDVEKAVQERIGQMTDVQRGSIVQALLLDDEGYKYVVAKVEHSEWYDGETLEKNFGFPGQNKRVWKSAVIGLDAVDGAVIFTTIKAYINTNAKYWTADFLEVQEAKTDAVNTKAVLHAIDRVLKPVKEKSPQDYYNLRNTVVHELQSEQTINYPEMVNNLLGSYQPASEEVDVQGMRQKLLEASGFDTQFHTDPKAIKGPGKVKIIISPSIDVLVKEGIPNWREGFLVHEKADGRTFLMIRCDDQRTLNSFPKDTE